MFSARGHPKLEDAALDLRLFAISAVLNDDSRSRSLQLHAGTPVLGESPPPTAYTLCAMRSQLSVITPCYNDFDNLESTLTSLRRELRPGDELVVVDSSADRERVRILIERAELLAATRYVWIPPSGVYRAQNRGLSESTGAWIQIVNSGDRLLPGARRVIDEALVASPAIEIHVFSQQATSKGGETYVFSPTSRSVWPHQSIIVARCVYDVLGPYLENFPFGADQIFFAKARKLRSWAIHPFILTEYLLGGLSAAVSFANSREIYIVRRCLGEGRFKSFAAAFVLPLGRKLLEGLLGADRAIRIKTRLFRHYSSRSLSNDRSRLTKDGR